MCIDIDEEMPIPAGEDDGMSAEDRIMDIELLHEKWESTPDHLLPLGVLCRLWEELTVDLIMQRVVEDEYGWDIEMWSTRKRRRIQELARAAVDEEKMVCAMRCVCIRPAYVMTRSSSSRTARATIVSEPTSSECA